MNSAFSASSALLYLNFWYFLVGKIRDYHFVLLQIFGCKNPNLHSLIIPILAVSAACTKVKKAFKSFGTIRIKIPSVELYKECTICAILRINTPICLAAREAKTCCAKAINNANPLGLSEKMFIA